MSDTKKLERAIGNANGFCVFIEEMRAGLEDAHENGDYDEVRNIEEQILQDPLDIDIHPRYSECGGVGFMMLISTGGPALRITGEVNQFHEGESPRLEVQDWFTEWIEVDGNTEGIPAYDYDGLLFYLAYFPFYHEGEFEFDYEEDPLYEEAEEY